MRNIELMHYRRALIIAAVAVVMMVGLYVAPARGANIVVTNLYDRAIPAGDGQAFVRFDVSWDASWRASWTETTPEATFTGCTNWDAAWIFVKYRCRDGANTNWSHASLSTNDSDHGAPANSTINVGLSTNSGGTNFGAGVFLYRSGNGNGSWTNTGVKLCWQYGADGVAKNTRVDLSVHAIEMVYVPQGSFYLGDGATNDIIGQFEDGTNGMPFLVTNDNYVIYMGGGTNGNLGNNNASGMLVSDDFNDNITKELPTAFPKGYNAFYCMKYEITQGQYTDFLNQLVDTQSTNRYASASTGSRYTIGTNVLGRYTNGAPTRACNYINWLDNAAYADWAGLRPITELEYEKACRGPLYPVTNECAWGSITTIWLTGFAGGSDGSGTETAIPSSANCNIANSRLGPVRVGVYATTNSSRQDAGASYWGIMEMSGNLQERTVAVGNTTGREFTGVHGDGKLNDAGDADVSVLLWPQGAGTGERGGSWDGSPLWYTRVSDRRLVLNPYSRKGWIGGRAGRSVPGMNP